MGRAIGSKHRKKPANCSKKSNSSVPCLFCGQLIHPRFVHRCYKVKDLPAGQWNAHGKGAFKVIEYADS
jgi:hypothetical protein